MKTTINSIVSVPHPSNEPVHPYAPGDSQRNSVEKVLKSLASEKIDIPSFIGNDEIRTGDMSDSIMPHDHSKRIGFYHLAGPKEMEAAVAAAKKAKPDWEAMPWKDRVAIFLKAADLLAGPYRDLLNASTMLGQSKNIYQAEIDAACELIDFFRFNAFFYKQILESQPESSPGVWNQLDYRPLEGFVLAITPFNFTSIAGNLPCAPALVGNTVIWKPSSTQMHSAYFIMKLLKDAGLPDGVINLVGCRGMDAGKVLLPHKELAGVHFTGSTVTFQSIYRAIGENISHYPCYPRIVGETGGKDFIFAHESASLEELSTAIIRGAFEYQGQKCSAASRAYIPKTHWPSLKERLIETVKTIKMGDPQDFGNFMNAVIDKRAFDKIRGYIEFAKSAADAKIVFGGGCSDKKGYFIEPTIIETVNPNFRSMVEEIFGPVITIHPYDENQLDEVLVSCDQASPYALTGAVFANDRQAIGKISNVLRNTAGNFYINDKPTGAVVGQQPFGGGRASGTNDKAGSILNLYRWISPRTIKETLVPPTDYRYPFLGR